MSLKSFLKSVYLFGGQLTPRTILRFLPILGIVLSAVTFYIYILKDLPSPNHLTQQNIPLTTHILDRRGKELYKIYSSQNRTLIKLADLPPVTRQAVLAIEDKDFYRHRGFSPSGIFRSLIENGRCFLSTSSLALSTCPIQGGSTITQQLVKTSLLTPERTVRRKLKELVLSLAIESVYTKDQILEMYLNRVGFGGTAYGIEEAAQTYFGVSSTLLDLPQSAFLAGLPASPTGYSPYGSHPELAKQRQKEVLSQMVHAGYLSWTEADAAAARELIIRPPQTNILAPHFVMYVKELLAQKYGHQLVDMGGLTVTTSLDYAIQEQAEKIISGEIGKISYLHISNGAGIVTRPGTGEILAMVGSRNYFDLDQDGNVNVTLASRQPGSAIKPVNYALAFQKGFTASSLIDDSPISYQVAGQPVYSPVNYDHRYHGRVTLRTALASSYNVPAVKLLAANGVENMRLLGQKMGITTWEDSSRFGLSLTLGGGEIKLTDLAVVYGVFANLGKKVNLNPILEVRDSKGKVLETHNLPAGRQGSQLTTYNLSVLDPHIAFLISDILSDNKARTPTFGARSQLYIPDSPVAVKTGTTNNLRDNWTIGFTPDFLVAVWVGNNDNSPMSYVASGVTGASPIWRRLTDFMLDIYPFSGFSPPSDIIKVSVCPRNGLLSCSTCPGLMEYFLPGTEPKTRCSDNPQPTPSPTNRILEGVWTVH